MKAHIIINSSGPGLVPFGYFELILPACQAALKAMDKIDESEILNEWRGELYLDDLNSKNFNIIIQAIFKLVRSDKFKESASEEFFSYWESIIEKIITSDPRYKDPIK